MRAHRRRAPQREGTKTAGVLSPPLSPLFFRSITTTPAHPTMKLTSLLNIAALLIVAQTPAVYSRNIGES